MTPETSPQMAVTVERLREVIESLGAVEPKPLEAHMFVHLAKYATDEALRALLISTSPPADEHRLAQQSAATGGEVTSAEAIIMKADRKVDAAALRTLADYIENDMHLKPGNKTSWSDVLEGVRRHYLGAAPKPTHPNDMARENERLLRPEVLAFAHLMEAQLRANDHKPGWKRDDPRALFNRLQQEANELSEEVFIRHGGNGWAFAGREAADVANFAMMIADVCGALSTTPSNSPAPADRELRDSLIRILKDIDDGVYASLDDRADAILAVTNPSK